MDQQNAKRTWNPWPVSIIAFFALAISGVITFVIFCNAHPTELVARDYYEQELRYQAQMERQRRANLLTEGASVGYDPDRRVVTVALPKDHRPEGTAGDIHLYRPSAAGLDRRLKIQLNPEGKQEIDAASLAPGLWKVKVLWTAGGQDYFIDQKVTIPASS